MTVRPLSDRLFVKPIEEGEKKVGEIFVVSDVTEEVLRGKVVAVGPGSVNEQGNLVPTTVSVGDEVCYTKYSGVEMTIDGERLFVIREAEVIGVGRSQAKEIDRRTSEEANKASASRAS